jgi:hypothetical protein
VIVGGICETFVLESFDGVHQPADEYRIALYTSAANLSPATQRYTQIGEIAALGYTVGGKPISGRRSGRVPGEGTWINFDDAVWMGTITARGALIYNASKENRAVVVCDFGDDIRSTNKEFTAQMPPDGLDAAVFIKVKPGASS